MKVMLDTNVLVSAFVFGGKVWDVLNILFDTDCKIYVSEYVDAEFKRILNEKWSERADKIYSMYLSTDFVFCSSTSETFGILRDEKDIPVLSDAIYHGIDILLTGDKDFLESNLTAPMIISPQEFLEYLLNKFKEEIK